MLVRLEDFDHITDNAISPGKGKNPKAESAFTTFSTSSSFTTSYTKTHPHLPLILFPSIFGINIQCNILSQFWHSELTILSRRVNDDNCVVVVFNFSLPVFSVLKHIAKCFTVQDVF